MNADQIMVITGGSLVEQGSHEELITANAKYAELWSKQIFVKPTSKEPTEDQPAKQASQTCNIVNDLSIEQTNSELAKAKSAPSKGRPKTSAADKQTKQASNHLKEV